MLEVLLWTVVGGFVVGALARLAVPGPDPMPWWATILLGVAGSLVGAVFASLLDFPLGGGFFFAVGGAIAVLVFHRIVVQKRPITGPRSGRRFR